MVLNEIALQDQVAIDMDNIVAGAGGDGLVADGGDAEPAVLVPDMADGDGEIRSKCRTTSRVSMPDPSSAIRISSGSTLCCITLSRHR